jgi:hypothetical protein
VTTSPVHRGEHEVSCNAIVQGMPGCLGEPVVTTLVCFFIFAYEAAGATRTRHSLRPLFRGTRIPHNSGAPRAAGMRRCASLRGASGLSSVMAGLDPAIHDFVSQDTGEDVDHRDKPGDDERIEFVAAARDDDRLPGHRRAEAPTFFERLCPAMTEEGGSAGQTDIDMSSRRGTIVLPCLLLGHADMPSPQRGITSKPDRHWRPSTNLPAILAIQRSDGQ